MGNLKGLRGLLKAYLRGLAKEFLSQGKPNGQLRSYLGQILGLSKETTKGLARLLNIHGLFQQTTYHLFRELKENPKDLPRLWHVRRLLKGLHRTYLKVIKSLHRKLHKACLKCYLRIAQWPTQAMGYLKAILGITQGNTYIKTYLSHGISKKYLRGYIEPTCGASYKFIQLRDYLRFNHKAKIIYIRGYLRITHNLLLFKSKLHVTF